MVAISSRLEGLHYIPPTPLKSCGMWSESCGLHEGSYGVHSVCGWFIAYYPTPMWCCGLWSGPCGLHEVYGLLIEGFLTFMECL